MSAAIKCGSRFTIDLTGRRFGRLIVESRAAPTRRGQKRWACVCDCGDRTITEQSSLRRGTTRSCGCLRYESKNVTHGHASEKRGRSSEYWAWWGMRMKCARPTFNGWQSHGALGIRVCKRWEQFEAFIADVGPLPGPEFSLVRINPRGNFTPSNTRWGIGPRSSAVGVTRRNRKERA